MLFNLGVLIFVKELLQSQYLLEFEQVFNQQVNTNLGKKKMKNVLEKNVAFEMSEYILSLRVNLEKKEVTM